MSPAVAPPALPSDLLACIACVALAAEGSTEEAWLRLSLVCRAWRESLRSVQSAHSSGHAEQIVDHGPSSPEHAMRDSTPWQTLPNAPQLKSCRSHLYLTMACRRAAARGVRATAAARAGASGIIQRLRRQRGAARKRHRIAAGDVGAHRVGVDTLRSDADRPVRPPHAVLSRTPADSPDAAAEPDSVRDLGLAGDSASQSTASSLEEITLGGPNSCGPHGNKFVPWFTDFDHLLNLRCITLANFAVWWMGSWHSEEQRPCPLQLPPRFEVRTPVVANQRCRSRSSAVGFRDRAPAHVAADHADRGPAHHCARHQHGRAE